MRIMLDTNVLISALLFPSKKFDLLMHSIFEEHTLVLSSYVVDELRSVVSKKFPARVGDISRLLYLISFEYVYTPEHMDDKLFSIRDANDYSVLYTAIIEDVDVFITGDKDFSDVEIDHPEILTPTDYLEKYL